MKICVIASLAGKLYRLTKIMQIEIIRKGEGQKEKYSSDSSQCNIICQIRHISIEELFKEIITKNLLILLRDHRTKKFTENYTALRIS